MNRYYEKTEVERFQFIIKLYAILPELIKQRGDMEDTDNMVLIKNDFELINTLAENLGNYAYAVFVKYYKEKKSYEEIADEYYVSIDAIRSVLSRARKQIKSEFVLLTHPSLQKEGETKC